MNDDGMDRLKYEEVKKATHAVVLVTDYIKKHLAPADVNMTYHVYVVEFSKTMQNWRALLSSTISDDMYYEVTYNGDKKESVLAAYKKLSHTTIPGADV